GVGRDEATAANARIEVQPAGDAVDRVSRPERFLNRLDVLLRDLLRVVEFIVVDQVAQPIDGAAHPVDGRLARPLRLVASRYEARDHRAERPDAKARLQSVAHLVLPSSRAGRLVPPARPRKGARLHPKPA